MPVFHSRRRWRVPGLPRPEGRGLRPLREWSSLGGSGKVGEARQTRVTHAFVGGADSRGVPGAVPQEDTADNGEVGEAY